MDLEELQDVRRNILDDAIDEHGFTQQNLVLSEVLPLMLDAKLIDSEDINESYFINESENLKINAYTVNESGERLQLFLINEESLDEDTSKDAFLFSQKAEYEKYFKKCVKLLKQALKSELHEQVQDADPVKLLINKLSSIEGFEQFDVFEIFLVSLTATVSLKGASIQPRLMRFDDDKLTVSYSTSEGVKRSKEFLLIRQVVDLNFLFNALASGGHREVLTVNFQKSFGYDLEVISAAQEKNFESYLCVLNAEILFDLYKRYSTRLLEKNVRSFLQFKGVNKGIKDTIRKEPEKFIAYNNGLTITATDASIFQNKKKLYIESLTDFQIVNGGQTTASIYFSKKDGLDIAQVKVMAKINLVKELKDQDLNQLISNISEYSNSQSRVSKVDLRARNPQLVTLKQLSDSVITPSGSKWFFERAKGEFNTKVRMAGSSAARIKRDFPTSNRFTKELLAKYYCAWGEAPYAVKKGGEKIFRAFIEQISPEDSQDEVVNIDRDFYESLIAKIIMFRSMEKIYGQGKNSMGQLRSAVIPYALSIIYLYSDGSNHRPDFNFSKIWRSQEIDSDLAEYLRFLMVLMNDLVKDYSASDDYGEYSKNQELWFSIKNSREINEFMNNDNSRKIFANYTAS
jgi:hypothetical protein